MRGWTVSSDDQDDREFAALSAVKARHADQVCDCFEATWRTGQRPLIEDFLDDASEPSRTILLRELIASKPRTAVCWANPPPSRSIERGFRTESPAGSPWQWIVTLRPST